MSLLEQFRIAIGDFRSYRRLATLGFGRSFTFFICFIMLLFVVNGTQIAIGANGLITEGAAFLRDQVPDFRVVDGHLSVDGPMPYRLESGGSLIIVDTTGGTEASAIDAYPQALLIDADRIVIKDTTQTRQLYFTELPGDFTKADVMTALGSLDWLIVIAAIGYFIWLVVTKLFSVLVLSLAASIANGSLRSGFDYPQLWNISLYGCVVPTFVSVVVGMVVPSLGVTMAVYWGLALFYVLTALRTSKEAPPIQPMTPVEPPAA